MKNACCIFIRFDALPAAMIPKFGLKRALKPTRALIFSCSHSISFDYFRSEGSISLGSFLTNSNILVNTDHLSNETRRECEYLSDI